MSRLLRQLGICLLAGLPVCAEAARPPSPPQEPDYVLYPEPREINWYNGFRMFVGTSTKQVTFTVQDKKTLRKQGALTEEMQTSPSIHFETPYYYFNNDPASKTGWYIELGYSSFAVSKQEIGDENSDVLVDMGTSVTGRYLYLTPVAFYNFGDLNIKQGCGLSLSTTDACGQSFKFGIGIGIGYLQAKGDIILTETPGQERVSIDTNEIGSTIVVLMEYRLNNWMLRARGNFPTAVDEVTQTEHEIYEFAMDVGLAITF